MTALRSSAGPPDPLGAGRRRAPRGRAPQPATGWADSGAAAFAALVALRKVKGTRLDLSGRTRHRREEQALAVEFAALVVATGDRLTPDCYDGAVALARSVQAIRGHEDIKSAAIARWRAEVAVR